MKKNRPEPIIHATLEILDDDNPVRGTVELSPAERVALETEKQQLLREVAGPRYDDAPRARRLGRTRPDTIVDPDAPGVEDDDTVESSDLTTEDALRARARARIGITPGRVSPPEPVDTGDIDDVQTERRQLDLSPEEIAQLEAERSQLVAQIRASRPVEADVVEPPVIEGDMEIPSSPELEAAAAAVAEVDAEVAALERERQATEKARIEAEKSRAAEHKVALDALQIKRNAADLVRTQALQKQASIELRVRAERARQAAARELERRARVQGDLNEQLRVRIEPTFEGCRRELIQLREFATENEQTLASLWKQSWKTCPDSWPMELRLELQREVSGKAYQLFMNLQRSLDAYPRHIKALEDIIQAGDVEGREAVIVQTLYEASISRPGSGDGITSSFRRDLARLNEIAADIYDRGAYAESLGVVHVVEEPAVTRDDQELVKRQLLRGGETSQQERAVTHPSQEASAREENEAAIRRVEGAVRQAS